MFLCQGAYLTCDWCIHVFVSLCHVSHSQPASALQRRDVATAARKGIHPTWHEQAPVICEGKKVRVVSGTLPEYKGERLDGGWG